MDHSPEQAKALLRSLLDQTSDAYFLLDPDGRILDVNSRAVDSVGYAREELLAMRVWDVEVTMDEISFRHQREGLKTDETLCLTGVHRRKNGSEFPVDVRVSLRHLGTQTCVMALARDVTESVRRHAEEEALGRLRGKSGT